MQLSASLILFTLAAPCFGQVLVEHSAAAAGGAMGAIAGKAVTQGLGSIGNPLDKAAKTGKVKAEPKNSAPRKDWSDGGDANRSKTQATAGASDASFPVFGPATAGAGMPASVGGVTRRNRAVQPIATTLTDESTSAPLFAPVPPPIPVHRASREEVVAIQPGTARGEVIAKLGPPASMVTIPDEGHLLETFKYVSGSSWVGTVRLDNGAVVKVDSPQQ
jgi:hypothetical protein